MLVSHPRIILGVSIHWTGLLDWTTGLEYWIGLLDWNTGLDYWTTLFLYGFLVYLKIFDTWRPQFCLNHHRTSVILQSTTS